MLERHIEECLRKEIKTLNLPCCEIVCSWDVPCGTNQGSWDVPSSTDHNALVDGYHSDDDVCETQTGEVKGVEGIETVVVGISASLHTMPTYSIPRVENTVTIEVTVYPERCPDGFSALEAATRISNLLTHLHIHHHDAKELFTDEFYTLDGILVNGGSALTFDQDQGTFNFSFELGLTGTLRQFSP